MKTFKIYFLLILSFFLLAHPAAQAQTPKKGWSNKAKGAAIGGGAGAVTGAVIGGGKGALIGGAAGVVGWRPDWPQQGQEAGPGPLQCLPQ